MYIDEIQMAGFNEEKHVKRLDDILARLQKAGLGAQKSKCQFMVYLQCCFWDTYRVVVGGLHLLFDKIERVLKAPAPQNL